MGKQTFTGKVFQYSPLVLAIVAIIFTYYLYRKMESNNINDEIERFMMLQRKTNKDTEETLKTIEHKIEEEKTQKTEEPEQQIEEINDKVEITIKD